MNSIQEFVKLGLDRDLPQFEVISHHPFFTLNLGAGRKPVGDSIPLNEPNWMGGSPLPYENESVAEIYSFHFFEHLTKDELLDTLLECQRVLVPGGILNVVVPYYSAAIAHQDIDHKLFFTEETWKNIFDNPYYEKRPGTEWTLRVGFNFIGGIVERNLCLFTQLLKEWHP